MHALKVPDELKNQSELFQRTSKIMRWTNVKYPYVKLCHGPGKVIIPCLMHDTCICQIDVNMTNN